MVLSSNVGGKLRCLFGAETDGVEKASSSSLISTSDLSQAQFSELKCKIMQTKEFAQIKFHREELCWWWAQSALASIRTIYCGWRDYDFNLQRIETIKVAEIPQKCEQYWSPAVMIRTCSEILDMISTKMESIDCPDTVYEFSFDRKISSNITVKKFAGPNKNSFLPKAYLDCFK